MEVSLIECDVSVKSPLASMGVVVRRDFLMAGAAAGMATCIGGNRSLAQTPTNLPQPVSDQDREYMRQAIQLMRQAGVVDKTGGPREQEAFAFLSDHVARLALTRQAKSALERLAKHSP